ncbi:MAG: ABC-F family ATP-binding cassette domain-containing protein [Sphingomonadales bacterium]|nr:ABC-F family ATP-binding cassette domain-containing protein [Sphingomonadales bacterium]PIX63787.1 MAG: glycosyl transferase family 1 [Sphingomonadales bacterium CG_4_10_14_3_um_filter_58_15]NCO49137.1 ABC-F family ATP-binding cassette domain-containing protein [Sphingomonadales bacterium]NCP00053.1 ABC-F family ATP-binding cassette domain-containing protein [Sphingomonadales bacterium]NCP27328.1 ABC-F family ATP-binding cassette domain-containing protein [Sphingomonadales bacterium]
MLNFSNISVRLGGTVILDGATAALPPGARVGMIGRNGAGKSTLMKVIAGMLEPDDGSVDMPKDARLGYIAQEAPAGQESPLDTVLAADVERASLLEEAETAADPHRIGEIHERLNMIDAHSAPARAAKILIGLGFDEAAQQQPMDSFSGGWRMRVALAALLFSQPEVLLLDEPSNHLDLEATLWLENFLTSYQATILVISHERDLLNNVVDHILHLQHGTTTLYPGGYDAFEKQRAERQAQLASSREKQIAQREKLESFVSRWGAKAHSAKQAQSRVKALARMQPIAEAIDDPSLSFHFPSPAELKPPLITLDDAAVGYGDNIILSGLNMRLDPDDRTALLGRNGNGKTTLARLLASQLEPKQGSINKSGKLTVGYFTQYQVEELDTSDTPLEHMTRLMKDAKPGAVRAQLGRFGFSGDKATIKVGKLSGGERARLALAMITRDAPHLLILDEPTNHLDVDAREALVHALNEYSGAVILVSHDRHMLELTADRLVMVDSGKAEEFAGTLKDYTDFVLGKNQPGSSSGKASGGNRKEERRAAAERRKQQTELRKSVTAADKQMKSLGTELSAIDGAMFDPTTAGPKHAGLTMTELMKLRAETQDKLDKAEALWMEASDKLEQDNVDA